MFLRIDGFLIDRVFQPMADALAHRATPGEISQFLLTGCLFTFMVQLVRVWSIGRMSALMVFMGVVLLIFYTMLIVQAALDVPREGMAPRNRLHNMIFRILIVVAFVVGIALDLMSIATGDGYRLGQMLDRAQGLLELTGLYFMACRRNPPKRREAFHRELVGSAG